MEPQGSLPYSQAPRIVSILDQPKPVHIPTSHLLEIHPNIIHSSTPKSPQWSLSLRFSTKNLYTSISSPIRARCPAHLILLDFITRTILGEVYKSFSSSLCSLLHSPRYLFPLRSKYSPQHHALKYPQLPFLPQCQRPSFTSIQNNRQNYVSMYILIFKIWKATWKTKNSVPNDSQYFLTSIYS